MRWASSVEVITNLNSRFTKNDARPLKISLSMRNTSRRRDREGKRGRGGSRGPPGRGGAQGQGDQDLLPHPEVIEQLVILLRMLHAHYASGGAPMYLHNGDHGIGGEAEHEANLGAEGGEEPGAAPPCAEEAEAEAPGAAQAEVEEGQREGEFSSASSVTW